MWLERMARRLSARLESISFADAESFDETRRFCSPLRCGDRRVLPRCVTRMREMRVQRADGEPNLRQQNDARIQSTRGAGAGGIEGVAFPDCRPQTERTD